MFPTYERPVQFCLFEVPYKRIKIRSLVMSKNIDIDNPSIISHTVMKRL